MLDGWTLEAPGCVPASLVLEKERTKYLVHLSQVNKIVGDVFVHQLWLVGFYKGLGITTVNYNFTWSQWKPRATRAMFAYRYNQLARTTSVRHSKALQKCKYTNRYTIYTYTHTHAYIQTYIYFEGFCRETNETSTYPCLKWLSFVWLEPVTLTLDTGAAPPFAYQQSQVGTTECSHLCNSN